MDDNFFLIGKQYNFTAPQFSTREIDYGEPGDDLFLIKIISAIIDWIIFRGGEIFFLQNGSLKYFTSL